MSTAKQALIAMYARYTTAHQCHDKLRFKSETQKTNDNYVYTFNREDKKYHIYKIVQVLELQLIVNKVLVANYYAHGVALHKVGIFRFAQRTSGEINLPIALVMGKCIIYDRFVVTIPTELIME